MDQLEAKITTLPTNKPIVFVCGTGARSGESYYMVQDLRPEMKNVYYLEGELTFKKDGSFEIKQPVSYGSHFARIAVAAAPTGSGCIQNTC